MAARKSAQSMGSMARGMSKSQAQRMDRALDKRLGETDTPPRKSPAKRKGK